MFTIASLWIPFTIIAALGQVARNAMQRQLTGPLGTWGATNIRFLFGFPFSILFFVVVIFATGDAVPWPTAVVLAVAAARRAQPDRRHRLDAAGDERPLLRGDHGVHQDRGDPDRDLRFCLSRRSSHGAEGDRDPDRHRRRGHHRAAAGRRKGFCRIEADHHRPGGRGFLRAVGDRLSRRHHHGARRNLRDGGDLHAGMGPVRADPGADDLSAGAGARRAQENLRPVEALDAGGLHGRVRLAVLVPGLRADGGRQRPHAGAGRGAVRAGGVVLFVQAAAVGARAFRHRADRDRRGACWWRCRSRRHSGARCEANLRCELRTGNLEILGLGRFGPSPE